MRNGLRRISMLAGALVALAGCATYPAGPSPAGRPATPAPVSTPAPAPAAPRPATTAAPVDSGPSRDAQDVLRTIPEPLAPGERVPAAPSGISAPAPAAAFDTLRTPETGAGDSAASDVPVPERTSPLGDRPTPGIETGPDSTASAAPSAPSAPPRAAPAPSAPPATSATSDTCWRLQIAAPAEADKAASYREAAQSVLLVPMVIEQEKGLHKVRTQGCFDRTAADALKRRALDSGFAGAFRFIGRR